MSHDIFGKALMEYYEGTKPPLVIRRDDGHVEEERFIDIIFSDHDKWSECERKALEYVKGRVLDIGCGAGRHSLWLQEKDFKMVAIDLSPLAVEVSKLRGVKDCRVMNVRNLLFPPNSFDTILLMGNNFGVAGNVEGTKELFKKFYQITSKDAIVIATSRDPTITDNPAHLKYHELEKEEGPQARSQFDLNVKVKLEIGLIYS